MSAAVAGAVAAPIIGGMIGAGAASKEREAADRVRQQMLAMFGEIRVPTPEEQKILLETMKVQGELTPEMEQVITQGSSELANVSTDPRLKDAQLAALSSLQEIAGADGMSTTDKVKFNQIQSENNRNEQGQRGAIMQDMARRGQAGSGMELAAQLMNQQASAERASQQGMDVKAQAERRALEALMQGGQLAGDMRGQEFSEKARAAEAQDAINRFNAANRQSVLGQNTDRRNQAQASNLDNRQSIANTNVGVRNQQEMHNKGLVQQNYDNKLKKAAGMTGQMGGMAQSRDAAADRSAGMWSGIGAGVGQGFAAYGRKKKQDEE